MHLTLLVGCCTRWALRVGAAGREACDGVDGVAVFIGDVLRRDEVESGRGREREQRRECEDELHDLCLMTSDKGDKFEAI